MELATLIIMLLTSVAELAKVILEIRSTKKSKRKRKR